MATRSVELSHVLLNSCTPLWRYAWASICSGRNAPGAAPVLLPCKPSVDDDKKTSTNIPQTLADIFEMLFLIQEYSEIQIYANEDDVFIRNNDNEICCIERSIIHEIGFQPYTIDSFMEDWQKMHDMYLSDKIDEEVYALWKEKTLKKAMSYLPDGTEIQPPQK